MYIIKPYIINFIIIIIIVAKFVNLYHFTAILDGGIGETQLNTILTALNVPTVNRNLIKRYERLVGPAIENVAKKICLEALKVERKLTIENEG